MQISWVDFPVTSSASRHYQGMKRTKLHLRSEIVRLLDTNDLRHARGGDGTITSIGVCHPVSDVTQCRLTDKVSMILGTCTCRAA
jgi:hypothetical protein